MTSRSNMVNRSSTSGFLRFTGLAALLTLTVGCAAQGVQSAPDPGMARAVALSPAISTFLDNATPGTSAAFVKTPWGSNVSLQVNNRYHSASGRLCAQLNISPVTGANASGAQVACKVGDKGWQAQRLVTAELQHEFTY